MTLADLLNSPSEIKVGDKTYKLRQPTLTECGLYQRWLETEARASAARATELDDDTRRMLLRDVQADIAAQRYAWGGDECLRSLQTPNGIAKMMSIVCGIPEPTAREVVGQRLTEIAAAILGEAESNPEGKGLAALLRRAGLPQSFFASSSSPSPTSPTAETSPSSDGSPSSN